MLSQVDNLQSYADSLVDKDFAPAVSLAIWHDNKLSCAAAGVLNIATDVEATTEAVFQIGSITKVFTTCLVMQLVDEGKVDLDKPIQHYLRDFQIADTNAAQVITVRHLLNHTSGIAGDFFPNDFNEVGNSIARFVDRINLIPLVHSPGAQFSYSNTAFAIAGRLVEVMLGLPYSQAVEECIFRPLGMNHAIANPQEILRYRAAIGHYPDPEGQRGWVQSSQCFSTLGLAPSGSILSMSATDLITFARAHLNKGCADTGEQWLSRESIQLMGQPSIQQPANSERLDRHWCLGWAHCRDRCTDTAMVYHSGLVSGQTAMLQLFPDHNVAIAVMLNGAKVEVLNVITHDLIKDLTGVELKEPVPNPFRLSIEGLAIYTGTFDSFASRYIVNIKESPKDDTGAPSLIITCIHKSDNSAYQLSAIPLGEHIFAIFNDQNIRLRNAVFIANSDGTRIEQFYPGLRVSQRI